MSNLNSSFLGQKPIAAPNSEQKALDALLERLSVEVDAAKTNSDAFSKKVSRLASFELKCDAIDKEKPLDPEGLLATLNELINRLQYINRRNNEIYQEIDKIM
jgi:hypothetical protein